VLGWVEVGVGIEVVIGASPGGLLPGTRPPPCRPAGARHQPPQRLRPWRGLWTTARAPPAGRLRSPLGVQAQVRRTRTRVVARRLTLKRLRALGLVRRRGLETSSGPRTEHGRRHPRRRCQTVQHGQPPPQRPTHSPRRGQTRTRRTRRRHLTRPPPTRRTHDQNSTPTHRTRRPHPNRSPPTPTHRTRRPHRNRPRPTPTRWTRPTPTPTQRTCDPRPTRTRSRATRGGWGCPRRLGWGRPGRGRRRRRGLGGP
jgi:hypothetical protein